MYNDYFGLADAPFSIAPDPRYLYMSERHREALAHLFYGLQSDGGIVLVTGEVGTGKTTLCHCLLEQVPDDCDIVFVINPKLTLQELLTTLCEGLGIPTPDDGLSLKALFTRIYAHLLHSNGQDRRTALVIDEAQCLSSEVLELLRLLTNLETHRHKLLKIMLLGQPELRDTLDQPAMRQLAQRIVARYHLEPLTRREVATYVQHRLALAGARSHLFPPRLLGRLHTLSGGTPRLINLICDRALLGTYVQGKARVEPATLEKAAREVLGQQAYRRKRLWPTAMAAALVLGLFPGLYAAYRLLPVESLLASLAFPPAPARQTAAAVEASPSPVEVPATEPGLTTAPGEPQTGSTPPGMTKADSDLLPEAPPAPGPDEALEEAIVGPSGPDAARYEALAVRALFDHWQAGIKEQSQLEDACRQAQEIGLICLYRNGGPDLLRSLASPAILELRRPGGGEFPVTLLSLAGDRAQLVVAERTQAAPLAELFGQWNGRYVQLQQAPLNRSRRRSLDVGSRGPEVAWVDQQLAHWKSKNANRAGNPLFTPELKQRVMEFQRANGLPPDGVVGQNTLERLAQVATGELPIAARQAN